MLRSSLPVLVASAILAKPLCSQQPTPRPSPVARIVVSPSSPTVSAGDSLRLSAIAVDSAGHPIPGARVTFYSKYEEDLDFYHTGAIDSSGVIHAGTVGSLVIQVTALVPGAAAKRTTSWHASSLDPRCTSRSAVQYRA